MKIIIEKEDELNKIVDVCLDVCRDKNVFLLQGELGSGKTAFVRCFCRRFLIEGVMSPSFNIAHIYQNENIKILHADMYRLSDEAHIEELDLYELIENSAYSFIEWPEIAAEMLKDYNCAAIKFKTVNEKQREIEIIC